MVRNDQHGFCRARRVHARFAGQRRPARGAVRQARAVGRRRRADLQPIQERARRDGRQGALCRADLCWIGLPSSCTTAAGYCIQTALAEMFSVGVKAGVEPLALWEAVRDGAGGRRAHLRRADRPIPAGKYEPAAFALRLAHKDMSLATQLGRDFNVPIADCQFGARRALRGAEPRLGRARLAFADDPPAGARRGRKSASTRNVSRKCWSATRQPKRIPNSVSA